MTATKTRLGSGDFARRIRFEQSGNIAATDVQEAIEELDAEKQASLSGLTDNRLIRADGATALQQSDVTVDDSGNVSGVASFTFAGALTGTGVISPPQLGATENDYNPTGLSTAYIVEVQAGAGGATITGLAGGVDGRSLIIVNRGTFDVILSHNDVASLAANEIVIPGGNNLTLISRAGVWLFYDNSILRWRALLVPSSIIEDLFVEETMALQGDRSPSQITASQNDYNPTGLDTASVLRLTSDASRNITGLAGGADGRVMFVLNVGSNDIVLVDESVSSSAANRFALDGNLTLSADTACGLWYDSTSTRWRLTAIAKAVADAASTTAAGIVELATAAEAEAQTDNTRAVPPLALANFIKNTDVASTIAAGIAELATDAETQTGTATDRVLTPANLTAKEATATQWRDNTADRILTTDIVYSAAAIITLVDAATIAVDMDTGFNFQVTLAGNRTLGNPTNTEVGQSGAIVINQDATGSRTLAFAANWEFVDGTAPTLTTAANAKDILFYWVQSSTSIIVTGFLRNVS